MDARQEIREFLTSRRAKLQAADIGLPDDGARRVPGLRREEVASLADVSVPYHSRLERGDLAGASDSVLDALARALRLDDIAGSAASDATVHSRAGSRWISASVRPITPGPPPPEIGAAAGRAVRYVPVSLEQHEAERAAGSHASVSG